MMSSEERKEIVAYLYKLIKESPLFKDYTDDRIREAAVRAEHKAYTSSSTKDEYLRAMNSKAQRIKSTKTNEALVERNSTGTYNSGYGQYSYPPMYQEPTYVNQTYERKEPAFVNQRNPNSYANKSADLYQNGYQQGNFYNREMPSRNQTLFNNVTIKDPNKNYNNRMYNGREYERPLNHVNNNLNSNYAFVNPQTSTDSFMYVNELNGHLKYDQNHNQPYSGGYQVRSGYITERGFHSNQNLFENYPEPQYTKFQPAKKMSDFKPSVS
ncbi:MADS domain containing protein [Nosema bombycis CQ1]|uniref:MADS domain containing protein n=1 Tax=Nosema bombycis (strain CQ1 / CVCC 102059) TaxID=578461 RepID=R0MKI9_NOSB1|nr:MADS domain containing protein [Nosema bombycis CQ1]|eukprot:EOB13308.1 MADS domain containing protein [Nosema bombycis CQ1]